MSSTEIYAFDSHGNAGLYGETDNSWLGGMAVWNIMEEKYLPPYIPDYVKYCNWYRPGMSSDEIIKRNGFRPQRISSLMDEGAIQEIWDLFSNPEIPLSDRIVLGTTYDRVVVKNEDIPKVIQAYMEFDGETSLKEQAEILQLIYDGGLHVAVAWNQTSTSPESWDRRGQDKGGTAPYNIYRDSGHWFLFDELGGD